MRLARVTGTVVSSRKDESLVGQKLLVIQPLHADRRPDGPQLVALDSVGAGVTEEVFFVRGREAAIAFSPEHVISDATIVGIVDHWNVGARRA